MTNKKSILKTLKAAEQQIVILQDEKEDFESFIGSLMKQQKAEAEEMKKALEAAGAKVELK